MMSRPHDGPSGEDLARWSEADRLARPARLARLRERMAAEQVDAFLGARSESSRYLTGFVLGDGEDKVAGWSGHFLVSADEVVVLADSRYRLAAAEQCPESRIEDVYGDLAARWPDLVAGLGGMALASDGARRPRLAVEAASVSHATWVRLVEADPRVELVPAEGWVEELRQVKEPAEIERIRAACRVADAALEAILPMVRPGVTERELALALEWQMRTHGSDGLAFEVACLSGPRAALPHGSPGERPIRAGEVVLFDFGARVDGYRSDMTRTLFVGTPSRPDLDIHALVSEAQGSAIEALRQAVADGRTPTNREIDAVARGIIEAAGQGPHFGHGLGHGIGLATHELPSLGRIAAELPLPSPSVFSVEPGVYLDERTGVRIEDLVLFDVPGGRFEVLTGFPAGVVAVGQ